MTSVEKSFRKLPPCCSAAENAHALVDVYEVFCALLYILKSDCQWDRLPVIFPAKAPCITISNFGKINRQKRNPACWNRHLKNAVGETRINRGRNSSTTFVIIDAQSVKNTDTAREKGYDAGKKVSGIKRHIR